MNSVAVLRPKRTNEKDFRNLMPGTKKAPFQLITGYVLSVISIPFSILVYGLVFEIYKTGSLPGFGNLVIGFGMIGGIAILAASVLILVYLLPAYLLLQSTGALSLKSIAIAGILPSFYFLFLSFKKNLGVEIFWLSVMIGVTSSIAFYFGAQMRYKNETPSSD